MIGKPTPIGKANEPITNKDFRDVLLMMSSICTFLFDEYGLTDRIVKENSQIRNVNQTCDIMTMLLALAMIWKNSKEP